MPRTSSSLLAVKAAVVNGGEVVLPLLVVGSGWGELRGTPGMFRGLVDALAGPLGVTVAPKDPALQKPKRQVRFIVAPAVRRPVFKSGGRLL